MLYKVGSCSAYRGPTSTCCVCHYQWFRDLVWMVPDIANYIRRLQRQNPALKKTFFKGPKLLWHPVQSSLQSSMSIAEVSCNLNLRALIAHVIDSLPTSCMRALLFRSEDLCPGRTEGSASLAEDICSMRLGALIRACLCWYIILHSSASTVHCRCSTTGSV